MIYPKTVADAMHKPEMRMPTGGMMMNGQMSLYDALGPELARQKKLREIKAKYGTARPVNEIKIPWGGH